MDKSVAVEDASHYKATGMSKVISPNMMTAEVQPGSTKGMNVGELIKRNLCNGTNGTFEVNHSSVVQLKSIPRPAELNSRRASSVGKESSETSDENVNLSQILDGQVKVKPNSGVHAAPAINSQDTSPILGMDALGEARKGDESQHVSTCEPARVEGEHPFVPAGGTSLKDCRVVAGLGDGPMISTLPGLDRVSNEDEGSNLSTEELNESIHKIVDKLNAEHSDGEADSPLNEMPTDMTGNHVDQLCPLEIDNADVVSPSTLNTIKLSTSKSDTTLESNRKVTSSEKTKPEEASVDTMEASGNLGPLVTGSSKESTISPNLDATWTEEPKVNVVTGTERLPLEEVANNSTPAIDIAVDKSIKDSQPCEMEGGKDASRSVLKNNLSVRKVANNTTPAVKDNFNKLLQSTKDSQLCTVEGVQRVARTVLKNRTSCKQVLSRVENADEEELDIVYCKVQSVPKQARGKVIKVVIDLDEEELKGTRVVCCNLECRSDKDLMTCPLFAMSFYHRKPRLNFVRKVCSKCFETAICHQETLTYTLLKGRPLVEVAPPVSTETICLSDSDEEVESNATHDDEDYITADVFRECSRKLPAAISQVVGTLDISSQINGFSEGLYKRLTSLEEENQQYGDLCKETQKKLDLIRDRLYSSCQPKIRELPPVDIAYKPPEFTITPKVEVKPSPTLANIKTSESPRKHPLAGVATKKVTQIQRSLLPSGPPLEATQEVVALEQVCPEQGLLPPVGTVCRPTPKLGDMMYVMKGHNLYSAWNRAKIVDITLKGAEVSPGSPAPCNLYKVKFESSSYRKSAVVKQVTGKQMAYPTLSPIRLPVGTRCIAVFNDSDKGKDCYYAGMVAEPPKHLNKFRYLVFFDDGYAQYVSHDKILLVCECSQQVWEDIHPDTTLFICDYLQAYPERPMVKMQQGQIVKTEWNGKWWIARVVGVDASLVKMHFDADDRTEWIYRGSTRLGPLFSELAQAAQRRGPGGSVGYNRHSRGLGVASLKQRNMPYVEYTRGADVDSADQQNSDEEVTAVTPARAVAKKSTTHRRQELKNTPSMFVDKSQPEGKIEYMELNTPLGPKKFKPHQCGSPCITWVGYDTEIMKGYNPLVKPMLNAWTRQMNRSKGKRYVTYQAPCGRKLRNMEELHRYLRITRATMTVDQFDFDHWVQPFTEFVLETSYTNIRDLSYGTENVPVQCVNYVDHHIPDYVHYSTQRSPMDGVELNLDPEFLACCDCTDDCLDKEKCSCWQLTIKGTAYGPMGITDTNVGYTYKRLPEPVMTGIYECNSRCKCLNTCLNRVVQLPLESKLQVFKTVNRGWGIRCLNDFPRGSFVCIYAGNLLTEQGANEEGKNYGDEYLAELDYIEVAERCKEGYESDVVDDDDTSTSSPHGILGANMRGTSSAKKSTSALSERITTKKTGWSDEDPSSEQQLNDSDEEFRPQGWGVEAKKARLAQDCSISTRLRKRGSRRGSDDDQSESSDSSNAKKKQRVQSADESNSNGASDEEDADNGKGSLQARQPQSFGAVSNMSKGGGDDRKHRSVREFYGQDECCYIMDAKNNGNIGRYLNHSCSPNVFVQNVFVDTHDLRFPWVAFFTLHYVCAGTELTWDYNYDVGSVPGKVLHCHCGSTDCRGRLL